jgi:hypothetical protein
MQRHYDAFENGQMIDRFKTLLNDPEHRPAHPPVGRTGAARMAAKQRILHEARHRAIRTACSSARADSCASSAQGTATGTATSERAGGSVATVRELAWLLVRRAIARNVAWLA